MNKQTWIILAACALLLYWLFRNRSDQYAAEQVYNGPIADSHGNITIINEMPVLDLPQAPNEFYYSYYTTNPGIVETPITINVGASTPFADKYIPLFGFIPIYH